MTGSKGTKNPLTTHHQQQQLQQLHTSGAEAKKKSKSGSLSKVSDFFRLQSRKTKTGETQKAVEPKRIPSKLQKRVVEPTDPARSHPAPRNSTQQHPELSRTGSTNHDSGGNVTAPSLLRTPSRGATPSLLRRLSNLRANNDDDIAELNDKENCEEMALPKSVEDKLSQTYFKMMKEVKLKLFRMKHAEPRNRYRLLEIFPKEYNIYPGESTRDVFANFFVKYNFISILINPQSRVAQVMGALMDPKEKNWERFLTDLPEEEKSKGGERSPEEEKQRLNHLVAMALARNAQDTQRPSSPSRHNTDTRKSTGQTRGK